MPRILNLILWAVPYSLAWSLKLIGVDLKKSFPNMTKAENKAEAALQQFTAIGLLAATSLFLGPAMLVVAGILGVIKIINLIRIDIN